MVTVARADNPLAQMTRQSLPVMRRPREYACAIWRRCTDKQPQSMLWCCALPRRAHPIRRARWDM